MRKRIITCCFAIIMIGLGISATAIQGNIPQDMALNQAIESVKTIVKNRGISERVSEELQKKTFQPKEYGFTEYSLAETIPIDQKLEKHFEYILTAKKFIDQVKEQEYLNEKQWDQCNQIFDTAEQMAESVCQNKELSDGQKSTLSSLYSEIWSLRWGVQGKAPVDYDREFIHNADFTKQCICTEYMTMPRLAKMGPEYIQRIDAIIKKVEGGDLTSQQGYNEIEKIWNEWQEL